ncbi:MAG: ferritin-like domain-containing protein [Pseudomonadota bacterium]|nr:ferritin-like domain-containing protein [Pseudomonadota bacterium]
MALRTLALQALAEPDLEHKLALVRALKAQADTLSIAPDAALHAPAALPGRPTRPPLIHPAQVPQRSVHAPEGRAALIHAICHIEFNAINLALDAVWRFAGMPEAFYRDWLRVACEEAYHFSLLHEHLRTQLGHTYGDFPAHDGLWAMCEKTADDITARMALVPRTLEARGLDATPLIQRKLRQVGTPDALAACGILDIILRDEIGHVAIGNHWYGWLCARNGLAPVAHYRTLVRQYGAPRLKGPFNLPARQQAGFSEAELAALTADGASAP